MTLQERMEWKDLWIAYKQLPIVYPTDLEEYSDWESGQARLYMGKLEGKKVVVRTPKTDYAREWKSHQNAVYVALQGQQNIVHIYGQTPDGSLVMDEYDINLLDYSCPDLEKAVSILLECVTGCLSVHKQGLVHFDIKAENFLVKWTESGDILVHLTDFGHTVPIGITMSGYGTDGYNAPETTKHEYKVQKSIDVYAFGSLLCDILFDDWNPETDKAKALHSLAKKGTPVSYLFKELCRQCWNENPAARPTIQQIKQELEHIPKQWLRDKPLYHLK